MLSGYSNTPLAKKLGIKEGINMRINICPDDYYSKFDFFPKDVTINNEADYELDIMHYFINDSAQLIKEIKDLKKHIKQNGMIWVSWPKKSSGIISDVNEDVIRNFALTIGLVDIKVCAIDNIWSALKLVIPVKERKQYKK